VTVWDSTSIVPDRISCSSMATADPLSVAQ
jgi:hypothetical protein